MDITSLEKAKQQWQFVADAIPILIFLIDQHGSIIHANRTLERWGLGDVRSIKGQSVHGTLHPTCTAADCPIKELEREALVEMALDRRTRLETFDPQLNRHLAINVQPILPGSGQHELLAVVSIDDTSELKRSKKHIQVLQDNLRERIEQEMLKRIEVADVQARLLNILSKTPNFIAMTASDGTLLYLNNAGRAMLKLEDSTDVYRLKMFECLTPEARAKLHAEALPTALRDGMWSGSSALLARDGREVPTTQVVIAHRGKNGEADSFSFVEQDMTAWVRSEAALRSSQEELRHLSAQLLNVQEDERRRIAADLHDVIGQTLSVIKLSIDDTARLVNQGATAEAGTALVNLSARVKDALVEVRRISMDLRPTTLDDLGILPTLSWFFREFEAACRNIRVVKEIRVTESAIPPPLKTTIFRLLQEATANIVKHSGADQISFGLTHEAHTLHLSIADNGRGFEPSQRFDGERPDQGLGLRSMKERARLSGGSYVLASEIGRGTTISVAWPLTCSASAGGDN
ncbi:MAG: sensor signal transduction histidine kinase [Proteobacteria bacterium]|nr:sensor signal transduction histidine kinase [Pseudomonadota bacterium]